LITGLAFYFRKRCPYLIVGWSWYLVCLSPTLGLIPVGLQAHADRYTYLPQIGLYIALAWLIGDLAAQFPATRRIWMGLAPAAVAGAASLAWIQTSFWRNTETLWKRAVFVAPNNDLANYNLALSDIDRGRFDDAIRHLERALDAGRDHDLAPHLSTALLHNALGIALARKGQNVEAVAHYRKAIELRDDFSDAHTNLGALLLAKGSPVDAIEHFRKVTNLPPEDSASHLRLGVALERSGQVAEATSEYRRALVVDPRNAKAHYLLANALRLTGKREEARTEADRAVELDSSQPDFKALQDQLKENDR
jgi:Tfp pilus assembly protein PilF